MRTVKAPTGMRASLRGGCPRSLGRRHTNVTTTRATSPKNTQAPFTIDPPRIQRTRITELSQSVRSLSSIDDNDAQEFRFLPRQLSVFSSLAGSMRNCSRALAALAFGKVVMNALEAVEHTHHHAHGAAEHGAAAAGAGEATSAVGAAVAEAAGHAAAAAPSAITTAVTFFEELVRSVSLNDVAFCVNEIIPALCIMYAVAPFEKLAGNPDEPHMALALKGVGRLSVTMQQLAWTSGSVAVVLLLLAATEYPPIVGVASGLCLVFAAARGAALWWVVTQHTTSGEEVARTLAALRGEANSMPMNPLDRAASWLALGALLQAEPSIHKSHEHGHGHGHGHQEGGHVGRHNPAAAAAAVSGDSAAHDAAVASALAAAKPHYTFGVEEERVLRSCVEAVNAAGMATSLQALALLGLGLALAMGEGSGGWVSQIILASQKTANALLMFASSSAFDKALHNDDGNDDTDHLLDGLGREHSGMTGLFSSIAVLSLALLMAGSVTLLIPSLEDSPLGVLVGDGVMHASADLIVEVLELI